MLNCLQAKVIDLVDYSYPGHPVLALVKCTAIATHLAVVADEATQREYAFDVDKLASKRTRMKQAVTRGQVTYEWAHLQRKLKTREPGRHRAQKALVRPNVHSLFTVVPGPVAVWERP